MSVDQTTENISFPAKDVQLYFVDNREPEAVFEQDGDITTVVLQED